MLARWFDRNGIGQYLAPDEKAAHEPAVEEGRAPFWQVVAPDPNFAPPNAPPPAAFQAEPQGPMGKVPTDKVASTGKVLCQHCNQWTNVDSTAVVPSNSTATPATPKASMPPPGAETPVTPAFTLGTAVPGDRLESLVMSAAKDTALSMSSPPHLKEMRDKVFRLCASAKPINDKLAKRLRNYLVKDPTLVHARATHMGQLVPDGFTPLMATAYVDHVVAANIILELSPNAAHLDRDLQGRTALHIAAEMGHMDMINLLLPKYQIAAQPMGKGKKESVFSPPPVDLLGRTPLGRGLTSPLPTARKRQKELESALFSPGDLSVFGVPRPESERTGSDDSLQLSYGVADMPGMRVTMEDAVCTARFEQAGKSYWLFGVCDGHGDRGNVSNFIATHAPSILQSYMKNGTDDWTSIWTQTCLELDQKLQQADIPGGSTGVFALVGQDLLVVANVGDSRAILVQQAATTGLEEQMAGVSVSEDTKEDADQPTESTASERGSHSVTALSDDHKPDLEQEKSRIEKAGMTVAAIEFEEDGKTVTIHKVAKTDKQQLAVSRSFGDFEYKLNTTLAPEEQAVTAVPDVRVQPRDANIDQYLILACDGIWDVMDNDAVKDYVLNQVQVRSNSRDAILPEVGDALLRESLNKGSRDNMSTVIVALSRASESIRPTLQGKTLDFGSPSK